LHCITISNKVKNIVEIEKDNIKFIVVPTKKNKIKYNYRLEDYFKNINCKIKPDIVHIHGTEYAHGLAWINACGNKNVVTSIQGLTSVIYRYSIASLKFWQILRNITLGDIKNKTSIFHVQQGFKKRGNVEKKYLESLKYIIGRTDWDKSHALARNPDLVYLFCNEILRSTFYSHPQWGFNTCNRHSIFLSQAKYPLKGLHMMLKAMPLILRKYPDTKLYVANSKGIACDSLFAKLKQSGYYRLIYKLIDRLNLHNHIEYLDALDEKEMAERFTKSHVFVCPSSIENSPNSLGEAQILGVPCISSFVGGTPEFMGYGKAGGLYRFEEYEMLADAVCRVFERNFIHEEIEAGVKLARERHDPQKNTQTLLEIYKRIIESSDS
jgi:glycosyltransferase involved in cell wall biosynthesis